MKKLPVRKEFPWSKIGSWAWDGDGGFTIAFCYPKDEPPFILKGGLETIDHWLEYTYKKPVMVFRTIYWHGLPRTIVSFFNIIPHYIRWSEQFNGKRKILKLNGQEISSPVRRIPRKWPVQLNNYIR